MTRRGVWLPLAALLLLGGCASHDAAPEESGDSAAYPEQGFRPESEHGYTEAGEDHPRRDEPEPRPIDSDAPGDEPPAEPPEDTAADPYTERAGATEDEIEEARGRVTFKAPSARLCPVDAAQRPPLPERARLAVTCVREGEIVHLAEVVLAFDDLLIEEERLKGVFGLGAPRLAAVGLAELAAQARGEGRDLLLVDVRPGPPGIKRTGYLVHTRRGELLARYEVPEEPEDGSPASSGGAADLCARMGDAYARAKD